MIRKLMMVGMLVMFLSATTYAFAEDVFITQRGSKYHKEECRLIKNKENVTKLDKKEAIEEGYGPCKRCFKEDVVVDEGKKDQNQAEKTK
ncbi:MAG: hypothetical protein KAS66_05760 [Candidatus Omnitrophica bacterium]|nr:hypothetical protein [Candidatus Omnitrophota bacterium]